MLLSSGLAPFQDVKISFPDTGTEKEKMAAKPQADGSVHIHVLLTFYDGDKNMIKQTPQQPD